MAKKIILCADGTWNTPQGPTEQPSDTNVRKLYDLLATDPSQLRYYDSGVGTDGSPFEHAFGGALGEGLFQKVQDGYEFLSYVWDPGDEIFILGFSRGAYTARSITGMVALFGVPTRKFDNQTVRRVFDAYRTTDKAKRNALKAELTTEYGLTDVEVRMVGVWDTVGALGIPGRVFEKLDHHKYGFLDTSLSPCIKSAYHAISIDEERDSFIPTLWTAPDGTPRPNDAQLTQVWFPGVHSDVGGGYAENQLSNITLRWMIDNAKSCGLTFDEHAVETCLAPKPFDPLGQAHKSWEALWGLPKHRAVPIGSAISNTVMLRLASTLPYKPENLDMSKGDYQEVTVIPVSEL